MTLSEMEAALEQAKTELRRADMIADTLARLLVGRVRKVSATWHLVELKRELRDFNIHTKQWKK